MAIVDGQVMLQLDIILKLGFITRVFIRRQLTQEKR